MRADVLGYDASGVGVHGDLVAGVRACNGHFLIAVAIIGVYGLAQGIKRSP